MSTIKAAATPRGLGRKSPISSITRGSNSHRASTASKYNPSNPNPQTNKNRIQRPNIAELLRKQYEAGPERTGLPHVMEPILPPQDKSGIKVVFPVDQVSRLDFDKLYQENKDYIL